MSRLRVMSYGVSLDGFAAGPGVGNVFPVRGVAKS
jgi:hypothetical protein